MEKLAIQNFAASPRRTVRVPGSKSITNRALVLAALADDKSILSNVLQSEDTEVMVACLKKLGIEIECDWPARRLAIAPTENVIPVNNADLYVANSGTTMRFLTAFASLGRGRFRLDGVARMRQRPIEDMLAALRQLGVDAVTENGDGCPPVIVNANGLPGGRAAIRGDASSQFLSGLLMAAPRAEKDVIIDVDGPLVSRPYVEMTLHMMHQFGIDCECEDMKRFFMPGSQKYRGQNYDIEPDASAASYFAGAAAILQGEITIEGLSFASMQGDIGFLEILRQMGCEIAETSEGITVRGGKLRGVDVDMNANSDTVMTLAAVACFAEGPTGITNVAHIRHKETDRITALVAELQRIGISVEERSDGLTITPSPVKPAEIETYDDHRMAMSFALIGLRAAGIVIKNPGCVAKTYPDFFAHLDNLR